MSGRKRTGLRPAEGAILPRGGPSTGVACAGRRRPSTALAVLTTAVTAALAALLAAPLTPAPAPLAGGELRAQQAPEPGSSVQISEGAVDVPRGDLFIRDLDAVWTAAGEVLEGASILIRDGRIRALGPDVEPPADVETVDGSGLTAMPGIVDAHSHIAMDRGTNEGSSPVVPEVRVLDAMDHEDFGIYRALSGGVTVAHVMHGSANPIGGQNAILKTRWGMESADQLLVQGAPRTVKFALGENVIRVNFPPTDPQRFPGSRVGVEQVYVQAFEAAREYRRAWEEYRENPGAHPSPPRRDLRLETLVDIMEGNIDVHAHSYRADEIVKLMRVAERFGFRIEVFQHVLEGYKVASELAEHGAGASTFSDWWMFKLEADDAIPHNTAIMHRHGVLTSINSDLPWLQPFMTYEMHKPVRYGGLTPEEAMRTVTLYPARQLRIDDRVGSLEVGKDGDVVLLSGDPFDTASRVEKTVVDGIVYYNASRDEETRGEPVRELPPLDSQALPAAPASLDDWPSVEAPGEVWADASVVAADATAVPAGHEGMVRNLGIRGDEPGFALVGGTVHTVSGPALEDGVVVARNGRIEAVGTRDEVEIPGDVEIHDVSGRHVYPGLVDPLTQIGLVEWGQVRQSRDDRTVGDYNPHLRTLAGLNAQSHTIPVARAAGVTTVMTAPTAGVIRGTGSVVQLRGDTPERMEVLDRAALVVDFPRAPGDPWDDPELSGEELEELMELFQRARDYAEAPDVWEDPTSPFDPNVRPGDRVLLEALQPAVRGEMPVLFQVRREREIGTLLLFLERFSELRGVVLGGDHAYRVADELAERGIPVILTNTRSPTLDRDDPLTAGWENPARLHQAGVRVAFSTGSAADVRTLPEHAARAAAYGLPREVAIQGITLAPAEILGLGEVTGSIEPGKRADLVVTGGDPLQIVTEVDRVFVGGEEFPPESKHTRLWERFRDRE